MGKIKFKFKVNAPDKNTEKIVEDSFMNFLSDISKLTGKPVPFQIHNKSDSFDENVEDKIDNKQLNNVTDNNVKYYKIMNFNLKEYYSVFDGCKWTYSVDYGEKFDSILDAVKTYEKARGNIKLIMLDDTVTESKLDKMLKDDQFRDYAEVIGFNDIGIDTGERVFFMQDTRMFEEEYDPYLHEKYFVLKFKGKDQYLSLNKFGDTVKPYRCSVPFKFNDEGIAIDRYKEYVDADAEYVFINDLDKYSDEELMVLQCHTENTYYEKYLRAVDKETKKAIDDNNKEFEEMVKEQTDKMLGDVVDSNDGDYFIFNNYNKGTYYTDLADLKFAHDIRLAKHYDSMTKALSEVSDALGCISLEVIKTNDPNEVETFIDNDPDTTFYQVLAIDKYDIVKERYFFIQDTRKIKEKYYPYFDSQYFIFKVYGRNTYLSLDYMFSMNDKPMLMFTKEEFKFNDEKAAIKYFEDYTHAKIENISKTELEKYEDYMIIEVQHYGNDKLIETKYFRGGESKEEETEEEVDIEPVVDETKAEFIYIIKEGDKYINKITDHISYTNDIGRALVFNSKADAYYAYGKTCNGATTPQVSKGEAAEAEIKGYTVFEIHRILSSDLSAEALRNFKGNPRSVDYYKVVFNNPVKEKKDENPAEKRIFVIKFYEKEGNTGWIEDVGIHGNIEYTTDIKKAKRFDDINKVFRFIEMEIYHESMLQISEKEAEELKGKEDFIEIQFYIGSMLAKKEYSAFYRFKWE